MKFLQLQYLSNSIKFGTATKLTKSIMTNETSFQKPDIKQKTGLKRYFEKMKFSEKYNKFIDSLIIIVSVWIPLGILISLWHQNVFPNFEWYMYLIAFIALFSLSYITLKLLKPFLFVVIILGTIYLIVSLITSDGLFDKNKGEKEGIEIKQSYVLPYQDQLNYIKLKTDSLFIEVQHVNQKLDSISSHLEDYRMRTADSVNLIKGN